MEFISNKVKFTINEVILVLKEDDDSYLKSYPKEKYYIAAIVFRNSLKLLHLVQNGYTGDVLPLESYYHTLDNYERVNKNVENHDSPFEYFKVIESRPVEGKVNVIYKEKK